MQRKSLALLLLIAVVGAVIFFISRPAGHRSGNGNYLPPDTATMNTAKPVVRIYLENSGSMDGFVTLNTQFKNALGHLIAKADGYYDDTKIFFVNDDIYDAPICQDLNNFVLNLNTTSMKVGHTGSSDINHIFKQLLDHTQGDTVSVLVSDCIYDVDNVGNLLSAAASSTTGTFMKAIRKYQDKGKEFGVIFMQMESLFQGYHYEGNMPMMYYGKRPYYIVMMGGKDQLADMVAHMELENTSTGMPGLRNKFLMSSEKTWDLDQQTARVLTSGFTNARRIHPAHDRINIHNIVTDQKQDDLKFAVGIGVEQLFVDRSYLLDTANYEISPEQYRLVTLTDKAKFSESDFFVHPIIMQLAVGNTQGYAPEITIKLKNRIPDWVKQSSYDKHLTGYPAPDQSYALYELVEGIYGAFHNVRGKTGQDIFQLKVTVGRYE